MTGSAATGDTATGDAAIGGGRVLVTGGAGFIGFHLARRLLNEGVRVAVLDSVGTYYDPALKRARLAELGKVGAYEFHELDLCDLAGMSALFESFAPTTVVNLAAQAGVRYSIDNPAAYISANVDGFGNVIELCKNHRVEHLVYASSSSVYGETARVPFSVHDAADHPVSVYAATKRANELLAHAYSHLFGLPTTGLRFFTVYGPWGRPDMAYYSFAKAILAGDPIRIFGDGSALRDFTYVDDVVESVVRVIDLVPEPDPGWNAQTPDPASSHAPWRLYNVGHGEQVAVLEMIEVLERHLGTDAVKAFEGTQPGDVSQTHADVIDLQKAVDFVPAVAIDEGLRSFVEWFVAYHS